MGRKPSLSKQIAEVLDTEDKREQLERVKRLAQLANVPPVSVTVLYSAAGVTLNYTSPVQVTPADLKNILNLGVDEITAQLVRAQLEQEAGPPDSMGEEVAQHLRDNPDQKFVTKDGEETTIDDIE